MSQTCRWRIRCSLNSRMNSNDQCLRILHLEDNEIDAELLDVRLKKLAIPYEITRVEEEEAIIEALDRTRFDVILSDSKLPTLDTARMLAVERREFGVGKNHIK